MNFDLSRKVTRIQVRQARDEWLGTTHRGWDVYAHDSAGFTRTWWFSWREAMQYANGLASREAIR